MSQLQERIAQFRKMAIDDPDNELGHFRLGQLLMEDGQDREAVKSFRRTLELSPQFSKVYQLLGQSLIKLNQRDEAIKVLKEGFQVAVLIIPYLVAIMVAVALFRASGAMDVLVSVLGKVTAPLGFPPEALPMALIRPLSGTGAIAVLAETMKTYGPDSFIGYLTSTINGSMETTFYVLAVYFGSVQVRALRHTVAACLITDFSGVVVSTQIGRAHV